MSLTYAIEHNIKVGAGDHIKCLAFSSKDTHIAAGIGSSVYIWELPNANLTLNSPIGSPVTVLKWFGENLLLAGSLGGALVMYEMETSKKLVNVSIVAMPGSTITHLAFSPNMRKLVVGGGHTVTAWARQRPTKDNLCFQWKYHTVLPDPIAGGNHLELKAEVSGLHFLDNEQVVICYRQQYGIRLYNFKTGKVSQCGIPHDAPIDAIFITPDGSRVMTPNHQSGFNVYDMQSGGHYHHFALHAQESHSPLPGTFIHAGTVLVGGYNNEIAMWHVGSKHRLPSVEVNGAELIVSNRAAEIGDDGETPLRLAVATTSSFTILRAEQIGTDASRRVSTLSLLLENYTDELVLVVIVLGIVGVCHWQSVRLPELWSLSV
ncbi:hypothetical protein PC9H_008937 [Pleurotus ostreatus]|uniref:WD40 repeat-like protein n=1 Tax=Pleurotus ostreatus TaxID=5322 RepID=A0A8H6ZPX3_PLEOS|nr:uncharacterized protein PC9H_008937 [Pleurotus ostreatus]KAF7426568.1 hypothetical protein PC9H_008937 [Pleurotus ostreatus]KAJ8694120.1 hypothetical protein PTI98_009054 [Pleurotus ostreatus]KAJ8694134.1 hypothetical protein PTI98_009068 [Pleurotus ostreatus]